MTKAVRHRTRTGLMRLVLALAVQKGGAMLTAIIITLIVGAIAGWLAGVLVQGTGFGLGGDIVVGILGALVAGFLFPYSSLALSALGGIFGAILLAFVGAVILLGIVRIIRQLTA